MPSNGPASGRHTVFFGPRIGRKSVRVRAPSATGVLGNVEPEGDSRISALRLRRWRLKTQEVALNVGLGS